MSARAMNASAADAADADRTAPPAASTTPAPLAAESPAAADTTTADTTTADTTTAVIAIAIIEQAGRYLVGLRPPGAPLAGVWEFPGGKVAPGETPAAAAVREAREEAGLDIELGAAYAPIEHAYAHGAVRLHFFAARPVDPTAAPHARFRWATPAELERLEFPAANQSVIARICQSPLR